MEQTLKHVAQQNSGPKSDSHRVNRIHNCPNHMWRRLEAIGPNEVHQMQHRILTPQPGDTKGDMFDDRARSLSVYKIAVGERVC